MKNKLLTIVLTILFFTVSVLDITGIALNNSLMQMIFKPMIILSLMALYYFSAENKNNWYLLALAFSFLGDVLLMDKNNLFLFGIASFLITQIIFIVIIVKQMERPSAFHKYLYAFLFVNYIVYLLNLLKPNLGELFYPVTVYGVTIAVFGLVATLNYVTKRTKPALVLMLGAGLFIASDSMIALNKFHEEKTYYPMAIMVTYVLAQYLIYRFMVKHKAMN
ncbi:MAG: lysoplasmalogenase [Flavobacteriaceae bacterium]|nr:lysoplasmalogenase [Flavobacteriaceae bacterium]